MNRRRLDNVTRRDIMSVQRPLVFDTRYSRRGKCSAVLEWIVRKLDAALKKYFHIFEYTEEKDCILRLAFARNDHEITLKDGTVVNAGETIGELHFWNEHIPPITAGGPGLTWALSFQRRLTRSLAELAEYVNRNPDISNIKAFRGELFFGNRCKVLQMTNSVKRCGFEIVAKDVWNGFWSFFTCFRDIVYNMALVWVFNPASLKDKKLRELKRCRLWMSRRVLMDKYLGKKRKAVATAVMSPREPGLSDGARRHDVHISRGLFVAAGDRRPFAQIRPAVPVLQLFARIHGHEFLRFAESGHYRSRQE